MRIEYLSVRMLNGRRAQMRVHGVDYFWPFHDLVEFSDGIQDVLMVAGGLMPQNAARPKKRDLLQLEGLRVQDAVEHNRTVLAAREVKERRAEGENVCGGDWYMEVSMNGADTDCSFTTVAELFQIVQTIIRCEMARAGELILATPPDIVHARAN